jgi:hypothetical protein
MVESSTSMSGTGIPQVGESGWLEQGLLVTREAAAGGPSWQPGMPWPP